MPFFAIDIGNTRLKWAQYASPQPGAVVLSQGAVFLENIDSLAETEWKGLPAPTSMLGCVVAGDAVRRRVEEQLELWDIEPHWVVPSAHDAGIRNGYDHPSRLGADRWVSLAGARARVIDWLAGLPFPIENLNAVLNGLGEELEVTFVESYPKAAEINVSLDAVSADTFVTRSPDGINPAPASAGRPVIEVRIGVIDSKRNPTASNHQRYARVRALVDTVLVPLHAQHAVAEVRIK